MLNLIKTAVFWIIYLNQLFWIGIPKMLYRFVSYSTDLFLHAAYVGAAWAFLLTALSILAFGMSRLCSLLGLGGLSTAFMGLSDACRGVVQLMWRLVELLDAHIEQRELPRVVNEDAVHLTKSGLSDIRLGVSQVSFGVWVVALGLSYGVARLVRT